MPWKKVFAIVIFFCSCSSWAASIDCIEVKNGSILEVELRSQDGHDNCFLFEGISSLKQLNIISKSIKDFDHKVTVFELDGNSQRQFVGDWSSDSQGLVGAQLDILGRRIGLSIVPVTETDKNKHLSVMYVADKGYAVVVMDISKIQMANGSVGPRPDPVVRCARYPCPQARSVQSPSSTGSVATKCSLSPKMPAGKHPDFDVDANLADFSA
ncbi:hypothetical protein ACG0Z6_04410 [Roseateles sp. BYS180W]|uniref:Uncharacterized protein n=1 Tax=Roseateles rivi TaxID=3299028 RepID=A0ABW7FT29_9BURK